MKYHIFIMLLLLNANYLFSQKSDETVNTCQRAIDAGIAAAEKGEFDTAINYFFAAEAYDPKRRKEVKALIDDVFNKIQELRKKAEEAEKTAKDALAEAERLTKVAEDKTKIANDKTEEATKAKDDAEVAKKDALAAKDEAVTANKQTEEALIKADSLKKKAEEERNEAELLRIEALSTSTALKSSSMKSGDQDTIKGLLAIRAFNMQKTMLDDSTKQDKTWLAPEIYTALHHAMIAIKGSQYDEFTKAKERHIGAVRSIFQVSDKKIYTSGSDGRIVLWDINEWQQNGRPLLNEVVIIRKEKEIITSTAITIDKEKNEEIIAIGGRFSKVQLIEVKKDSAKGLNLKQKAKPKNYSFDYKALGKDKTKEIYDLVLQNNLLYTLGKDTTIKVYNLKTTQLIKLIKLEQRAEHIAIHANGKLIAVGYQEGTIGLFEINSTDAIITPLYELVFKQKELQDKSITALTFHHDILAFGTSNGYSGLIEMIDSEYSVDNAKFRKVHFSIVSAIDFKVFKNKKGEEFNVMAIGSYDGKVSVWLLKEYANKLYEPFMFDARGTFVTSLKFMNTTNPMNNQLMVGYFDGTIKFWNMDINTLANELQCLIENKFNRAELRQEELNNYFLNVKFKMTKQAKCSE